MKISPDQSTIASLTGDGQSSAKAAVRSDANANAAAASASTQTDLSETSRALSASSHASAAFDDARVEQIKDAISAGHLQINPEAIAKGLISSVTDLLTAAH